MTHDRVRASQFALTQEFLSEMLGVRRAGVSEAAIRLQEAGLIKYSRGVITILNRQGLEEVSCECYAVIKQEYDRLLGEERYPSE
jgi:Mn-dependent DtxR family transcriptional regulator